MKRVKFGDIVSEIKNNVDRSCNPYENYVAGDHMDSENLRIERKGCFATDDVGPAFTRIFNSGDILYGSRRTYLKKVAVADFSGICANTTFVFCSKDPKVLDQRLLPFIMLSDKFTDWSVSHSKGSTNPYILFSDLAQFELDLPSIEEQKVLADKLWAAYRLKEAYKRLLVATDEMVKSQFLEWFGKYPEKRKLATLVNVISGKTLPLSIENEGGDVAYVKVGDFNLPGNERAITTSSRFVTNETSKFSVLVPIGSTVFAKNGAAALSNKKRITAVKICVDMNTMAVYSISDKLSSEFLFAFLQSINLATKTLIGAIPQIRAKDILEIEMPLPPLTLQTQFADIVHQADKSKFELKRAIEAIDQVIKSLING